MDGYGAKSTAESLILESNLLELNRVPPWVEKLASQHAIPDSTRYAMDLCLEEVLSNIIRHGYRKQSSGTIKISCIRERDGYISLVVEDGAPSFNPIVFQSRHFPPSLDEISLGGQGIHLLKQFADELEYEDKGTGNRLTISFISPGSSPASM
jgi:anti-sigma regulatory factor (Ser/Thr protein kinase)